MDKEELINLFKILSEKTKEELSHSGFNNMESKLEFKLSSKFLYTKYSEAIKTQDEFITIQENRKKALLNAAGFKNYNDYKAFLENPIHEVLKSCFGTWVSYVRQNSLDGIIYQSPVEIFEEGSKAYFKLRGPNTTYSGEITYSNGCLTTLFTGASGKTFHHIYKIGNRKNPIVLQGIYSGISTADDPIGGRAVLSRSDQNFDILENRELRVEELKTSAKELDQGISIYFGQYEKNNLRLNPIISFSAQDLK
ncbi:hypothetical protein [Marinoscillum pacificum]|uniref:hypothetical protein n=1 Tax=Marinoscillum pacificum TaxID=392723 RepID=UPI0021579F54|nr:hypothetical protein [Marinoscillum pacificum]